MRRFNTSGPCDPEHHYPLMREPLAAKGNELDEQGRYFTIFAPRQAGKTTSFQLLIEDMRTEKRFTPVWISFEHLHTVKRPHPHNVHQEFGDGVHKGDTDKFAIVLPVKVCGNMNFRACCQGGHKRVKAGVQNGIH